jgi:hypothetical protein
MALLGSLLVSLLPAQLGARGILDANIKGNGNVW